MRATTYYHSVSWFSLFLGLLGLCVASAAAATTSWGFSEATVSVSSKGDGVGGKSSEKLLERKALSTPISLGAADTLKVVLTAQEGRTPKQPHQTFLLLKDPASNLDISYPFNVKNNGKAKLELTHKDIPSPLLRSSQPIDASLVIASFGSSSGYHEQAFRLALELDPNVPVELGEKPIRYGKLPEIHHIFRGDPKSPNILITLVFLGAVLVTIPALLGVWLFVGANLNHLAHAMKDAPVAHTLFYGSILSIEGVFFMYYTRWNLFQTLPVLFAIGVVAFLSGSRALTEVQERRLNGLR